MFRPLARARCDYPGAFKRCVELQGFLVVAVLLPVLLQNVSVKAVLCAVVPISILVWLLFFLLTGPWERSWYYGVRLRLFEHVTLMQEGRWKRMLRGSLQLIHVYPTLQNEQDAAQLILDSATFNRENQNGSGGPLYEQLDLFPTLEPFLVVRQKDLQTTSAWQDAVFSILLLEKPVKLESLGNGATLHVDLNSNSCAIYGNKGKDFLRHKFLPPEDSHEHKILIDLSRRSHEFLMDPAANEPFPISTPVTRWASGGVLPIVRRHRRNWIALFFRDIFPVGWNIANGASENAMEYTGLSRLIYREAMEELVVCTGNVRRDHRAEHRVFRNFLGEPFTEHLPGDLCQLHYGIRREHDRVRFEPITGPELHGLPGPHSVQVRREGAPNHENDGPIEGVLIAINPLEQGIEVVKACQFALQDHECLLDGEVVEVGHEQYLARRPIALISIDYLIDCFNENGGSLGTLVAPDVKDLGAIPKGCYELFLDDIRLRKERFDAVRSSSADESHEQERSRKWLLELESAFDVSDQVDLKSPLTRLLPVTWKVIELAIKHGVVRGEA